MNLAGRLKETGARGEVGGQTSGGKQTPRHATPLRATNASSFWENLMTQNTTVIRTPTAFAQ